MGLYKVNAYLKHRIKGESGIIFFDEQLKKFLISPKWHEDKDAETWVTDTDPKRYLELKPYECLILGIGLLSESDTIINIKSYQSDIENALQIAIDNNFPIAHYYMAKLLQITAPNNKDIIKKHYLSALEYPINTYNAAISAHFNQQFKQSKTKPQNVQSLEDMYNCAKEDYANYISADININDTTLLRKAMKAETEPNNKASCFVQLAMRAERNNQNREALKFYILAESYTKDRLKSKATHDLLDQFPEFQSQVHYLKEALKENDDPQTRLDLIEVYFALNDIYKYLYDNKDKKDEFICKHEKNQTARQQSFFEDLEYISNTENTYGGFKSHLTNTAIKSNFNAADYGLYKGTQNYQDKRLKLLRVAQTHSMGDNMDTLRKATLAFRSYLSAQNNFEQSFPKALLDKQSVECVKTYKCG